VSRCRKRDRVVVVDDAANLRELLTILLDAEDDFEVVGTAADGAQAVMVADALDPDIVLLDLAMPVMDGLQALPLLRGGHPDALIVIFSGFERDGLVDEALRGGADAYLEKGASVTQLVGTLRELRGRSAGMGPGRPGPFVGEPD
jgi:DNA-binding NarL/FixJ family response regulator